MHICLVPVHSDMGKKFENESLIFSSHNNTTKKNLNIRYSWRRRDLFENDMFIKSDLHSIFLDCFKVNLNLLRAH